MLHITTHLQTLVERLHAEDEGFSTAELLGNAALGIVALVVIWGALQAVGVNVVDFIGQQIGVDGN